MRYTKAVTKFNALSLNISLKSCLRLNKIWGSRRGTCVACLFLKSATSNDQKQRPFGAFVNGKMLLKSLIAAATLLASSTHALYFYLDGTTPKCFYEELARDTLVVGKEEGSEFIGYGVDWFVGTYHAQAYNGNTQQYVATTDLAIQVTVDETFDNDHRVVSQTSTSSDKPSKFTFTAADPGTHRLCFTPSGPAAVSLQGWFSGDAHKGGVKLWLDMAIGESSKIESDDKHKIDSLLGKVKELNGRMADIRREQVFQRVSLRKQAYATLIPYERDWKLRSDMTCRNEKQSFEISQNQSTRGLSNGRLSSWSCWAEHALGNCPI